MVWFTTGSICWPSPKLMLRTLARRVLRRVNAPAPAPTPADTRDQRRHSTTFPSELKRLDRDVKVLTSELQELRREVRTRLVQYNHQLGRLAKVVDTNSDGASSADKLSGRALPQDGGDEHA